ncbi:hypothetical protein O3794_02830 [Gemella sanguinis]|uniref:hypothetical protein n=1 Tax=Gemella sanguinis TaxID=84135 RepID=UPI00352F8DD5
MSNIISVSIEDLGLDDLLKNTPEKAHEMAEKSGKKASRKGRDQLKGTSPRLHGQYIQGWSVRNKSSFISGVEFVIHNRLSPHSVHLLDEGHEMFINGKYTGRRVAGKPHFESAKETAGDLFEQYFDEGLSDLI